MRHAYFDARRCTCGASLTHNLSEHQREMEMIENASRIDAVAAFLAKRTPGELGVMLQVVKVQEEVGEAAGALLGWLAENPRKPSNPVGHLSTELADVAISALVAMAQINPQTWQDELAQRLEFCTNRLVGPHAGV